MNICIVGHGPSLKGARLGAVIDSADFVVRMKNCYMLLAEHADYGRRTDAMCSSTSVLPTISKVKASEYWAYPKSGNPNPNRQQWLARKVKPAPVLCPVEPCNLWNAVFLEMGGNHPNVSTGMGAIIIALALKSPGTLTLAGFDKVIDPDIKGYRCTVPTIWNKEGTADTGHDWKTEHAMLPYLAQYYNCVIRSIHGNWKTVPDKQDTLTCSV